MAEKSPPSRCLTDRSDSHSTAPRPGRSSRQGRGRLQSQKIVRFAAPNQLLAVLLDFPAGKLRDRHPDYQVAGKSSEMGFPTPAGSNRRQAKWPAPKLRGASQNRCRTASHPADVNHFKRASSVIARVQNTVGEFQTPVSRVRKSAPLMTSAYPRSARRRGSWRSPSRRPRSR